MAYIVKNFSYSLVTLERRYENFEEIYQAHWYDIYVGRFAQFTVLNDYDHQPVDVEQIINYAWNRHHQYRAERARERWGNYEFRRGPISGLSKRRRWFKNSHRSPKTTQERRELSHWEVDEDIHDYKIKVRKDRNELPTHWDDLYRQSRRDRSWKNYRKTQWKQK